MYKLFVAFRYLRAHKIIYFSIAGVAVGIMTLVIVTSIMGGFSRDMRSRIRGMQADIVVVPGDKQLWFPEFDELCGLITRLDHVRGCAPRIEYDAWLGRAGIRRDVRIMGVVPEKERQASQVELYFRQGGKRGFDFRPEGGREAKAPGVVLGSEIRVFGTVSLMTARDATVPIVCVKDFETAGWFHSGHVEYDSSVVMMHLDDAWQFLNHEQPQANVLAVAVDDYGKNGLAVRQAILEALHRRKPCRDPSFHEGTRYSYGRCDKYEILTWEQAKRVLLQAVDVEKGIQIIVLFMIVLVAGFNIIAIYTLVVRAKTRDIGILRALGATQGGITTVFLTSGGLCGLIGSIFGIGLGLLFSYNVNEIADFIRVVSREMNQMAYPGPGQPDSRLGGWLAVISLAAAGAAVIWNWLVLYRPRARTPWVRLVAALVAVAAAAWFSTAWLPGYRVGDPRYDPELPVGGRATFVLGAAIVWMSIATGWRIADRWRRRPGWVFFGFVWTLLFAALLLAIVATLAIAVSIVAMNPLLTWPGLELFPRNIYYLDRIPVYVDFQALGFIVAMTLAVSLVFSIYPSLRAAAADPIESIRDE